MTTSTNKVWVCTGVAQQCFTMTYFPDSDKNIAEQNPGAEINEVNAEQLNFNLEGLTPEQKEQAEKMLDDENNIFSLSGFRLKMHLAIIISSTIHFQHQT